MLPVFAEGFFRLHERFFGRGTFEALKGLRQSERWPCDRIESLQLARLRDLVSHAWQRTDYWRHAMESRGITPETVRSLEDLKRFPLLTKEDIRVHRERMVWRGEGRRVKLARTSGSTNASLEFYTSSSREAYITAARMRGHNWVGIRPGDKEMYFWAAPLEASTQDRIKQVRDWLRNDGFTNALNLTGERVREYVKHWEAWRPACLFGYVSSFIVLARLASQMHIDLKPLRTAGLKAIVTTSEMLGANRATIEQAFHVPVYDSYGIREVGLIAHECEHGTLHTNDELLLLETIHPRTLEPTDGEGELVATSLTSNCMPIIRYRTGDIVRMSRALCACGRSLGSVCMTGGRLMEFILTRHGKWVSCVAFIYVCRMVKGVRQIQARQDRQGQIRVLVAKDADFPADGVEQIHRAVRARLEDDDEILVEILDEIPPAPSGKQRIVISSVTQNALAGDAGGAGSPGPRGEFPAE